MPGPETMFGLVLVHLEQRYNVDKGRRKEKKLSIDALLSLYDVLTISMRDIAIFKSRREFPVLSINIYLLPVVHPLKFLTRMMR